MRWAQQPPQDWSQSTGRQHRPPLTSKHLRTFPPNCRIHYCFPCVFRVFPTILIYFDGLLFFQWLFLVTVTFVALLQRHPCEDCQKCQAMWLLKNNLDGHPGNCRTQNPDWRQKRPQKHGLLASWQSQSSNSHSSRVKCSNKWVNYSMTSDQTPCTI